MKTYSQISLTGLLITFLFIATNSEAQIGIKGGVGFSDIIFAEKGQSPYLGYEVDYLTHNYPLFSYQIGVFGTINLNKRFEFLPELMFIKQGLDYDIDYLYDDIVYQLHIYYLQMPLLFRMKMALHKKSQPVLFLGPYGSLKLKATQITAYDGKQETQNMENVNAADFGLTFGFGYDIGMPKGDIMLELRCSYGLVNMMSYIDGHIPDYYGPTKEKAHNVNLSLMFAYRFAHISKKDKVK